MDYTTLASQEAIDATVSGLKGRNFEPIMVENRAEALAKIKELIPAGASVMNGASQTLHEIGFVDYLKEGKHGWSNMHEAILAEKDPTKQKLLRRQASLADFYLGSVHGLSQTGEMLIASNSGSQLPSITFDAPNVIFVVGSQKIVPTLADTYKRLWDHVVALEDARMKEANGPQSGTTVNKVLVYHGEASYTGRKVRVILVKEKLGF